jgi:hypothetical protein
MRYSENNLVAGTALSGDGYNAVVIGFPFETIIDSASRNTLMGEILNFLDINKK